MQESANVRMNKFVTAVKSHAFGAPPPGARGLDPLDKDIHDLAKVVNDYVLIDVRDMTKKEKKYLLRVVSQLGYVANTTAEFSW